MSVFKMIWKGEEVLAEMRVAMKLSLIKSGYELLEASIPEVPIESSDLRNTGAVDISKIDKLEVRVGYGLPYAVKQHEDLTLRHDRTDGYRIEKGKHAGKTVNIVAGGKAKFLEDPLNENSPKYMQNYAKAVREVTKG